jgi:hypothetical protein
MHVSSIYFFFGGQGFDLENIINNMGFVESKFKIFISIEIGGFHGPQMFNDITSQFVVHICIFNL